MTEKEIAEAAEAELEEQARLAAVLTEIDAMRRAFEALRKLNGPAKRRAMSWLHAVIWNEQEPPF